jgi:hypothetical protein
VSEDDTTSEPRPDGPPEAATAALSERRQWLLVGLLVACVIGFPVAILLWPPTVLSFRDAFLGLAMIPGLLLGATALWLAVGGRS